MHSTGSYLQFRQQPYYPRPRSYRDLDDVKCDVCKINVKGYEQYNAHIGGAKHSKKVRERENMKKLEDLSCLKHDKKTGSYECTMCNVCLNSSSVAVLHITGTRHLERAKELGSEAGQQGKELSQATNGTVSANSSRDTQTKDSRDTNGSEKDPISNPPSLNSVAASMGLPTGFSSTKKEIPDFTGGVPPQTYPNRNSYPKRRTMPSPGPNYRPPGPNYRPNYWPPLANSFVRKYGSTSDMASDPTGSKQDSEHSGLKTFPCVMCDIVTNSETQLQQHLVSERHKARLAGGGSVGGGPVKRQRAPFNMVASMFRCDPCGISLNSQIQLDQHQQSSKHQNRISARFQPYPRAY